MSSARRPASSSSSAASRSSELCASAPATTATTCPGGRRERRLALGGLRLREPAGRAGADEDEPAAAAEPFDELVDDCGDRRRPRPRRRPATLESSRFISSTSSRVERRSRSAPSGARASVTSSSRSIDRVYALRVEVGQYHLCENPDSSGLVFPMCGLYHRRGGGNCPDQSHEAVRRRRRGARRRVARDRRRRVHRPRRPVRLRQVDAPAHRGGSRGGNRGEHRDRRPRRDRAGAETPRHRDGLSDLRALPAHDRPPEPRLRPEGSPHARRRRSSAG